MQTYEYEDDSGHKVSFTVDFDQRGPVTVTDGRGTVVVPLVALECFATFLAMVGPAGVQHNARKRHDDDGDHGAAV